MKHLNTVKKRTLALLITFLMNSFSILAASSATQLAFTAQPTGTTVGAAVTNVIVQVKGIGGTNVAQSGIKILIALNKGGGLGGTTNVTTDATGKAAFTNLKIFQAANGIRLIATATNLVQATSRSFNISKGGTAVVLISSTNFLVYGQSITFTATVRVSAPASGTPTGTVTFKDGAATLGTVSLNTNGVATFNTNRISAATASHSIAAIYSGDGNFNGSTSSNLLQTVGPLALTVTNVVASNKIYDGTASATLNFSNAALVTVLSGDIVTLNSASAAGAFTNSSAGTNKIVLVSGLKLSGASAANYSITQPATKATILPRNLTITATGVNKTYDGTTNAIVTLADNRLVGDVFTNSYKSAGFTNKNVGAAVLINVSGLAIGGTNAGNYTLTNSTATASANITPAALTVSGIIASNKVYDATTTAKLNFSKAKLATIFGKDAVTLNTNNATGTFANKLVGSGKTVTVTGLALGGTNAGDYLLTMPVTTIASITAHSLTITATGANKIYDGTTNATVTLTDNHLAGDVVTDGDAWASFTNKNAGTNVPINVHGLTIAGLDATNYFLTATNTKTFANITRAALTISGIIASNKIYDATTTVTLNFSNAALGIVFSGDTVTLNSAAAKGAFASKIIGNNQTVTITGLTLGGASSNNYALTQPTLTANISPRPLVVTAKGVNKSYDGTTCATVTLTNNCLAGDLVSNSYASASFTNQTAGSNILINVYGLAIAGTDSGNYNLPATNTTATANISPVLLTVAAQNLTRPYATTNPVLVWFGSGFVAGESLTNCDLTGSPTLTTTALTNSNVGNYPITISAGTLASADYNLKFTNGVLSIVQASTAALISTTLNPALTNQNITFAAQINPITPTIMPPVGVIQFKWNGTNKLGSAISLSSGAANLTVLAAALGKTNVVITAEYSDPAGNFSPSTNSLTQIIVVMVPPSKLSLTPSLAKGAMTGQLSGIANQSYVIQASTDLIHWTAISTNTADANGIVPLVDSNAVAFPSRFYRAFSTQ